jgi:alpha-glucan,water dikinase
MLWIFPRFPTRRVLSRPLNTLTSSPLSILSRHLTPAGERVENLSQVVVPEDLITIRAYVRWEEAGKPEETTPEWQAVRLNPKP